MTALSENIHKLFTKDVIVKLEQKRISNILMFMDTDSDVLEKITDLPFNQILILKNAILVKFASKMRTGDKFKEEILKNGALIPTGIKKLDDLLNGGLYTGFLYEFCGVSSCCKSQICMSIAANVGTILHNLKQPVLYIDTKGDFSAKRLVNSIIPGKDVKSILERISVTQPNTAYELKSYLRNFIKKEEKSTRLLIIDSLASLFYKLIGEPNESARLLNNITNLLHFIATEQHTAILVTNLTTTWQGNDSEEMHKASLGQFWLHVPTTRFTISRQSGSQILLTVTKSSNLNLGTSIMLSISETGIQ